jgi:Sec-independent protein translocase protein TatA
VRGWLEILLVGIVLLAIFGPRTLQSLARSAGRGMGQARHLKDKVVSDLAVDDLKKVTEKLSHIPRNSQDVVKMVISSDEKK